MSAQALMFRKGIALDSPFVFTPQPYLCDATNGAIGYVENKGFKLFPKNSVFIPSGTVPTVGNRWEQVPSGH